MSKIDVETVMCADDLVGVATSLGLNVEVYSRKTMQGFRATSEKGWVSFIWGPRTMGDQQTGDVSTLVEGWGTFLYDESFGPEQPQGYMRLSQAVESLIDLASDKEGVVIVLKGEAVG